MSNQVDPAVHTVEAPDLEPMLNLLTRQPSRHELGAGHHAELTTCEIGDDSIVISVYNPRPATRSPSSRVFDSSSGHNPRQGLLRPTCRVLCTHPPRASPISTSGPPIHAESAHIRHNFE